MKKTSLVFLAILAALSLGACEKKAAPKQAESAPAVVQPSPEANTAPDFSLTDVNTGKTVKLSDYRGKIVILDFWATWCPPCKAEIPGFIKLQNKYKKDGLVLLGIALDDETKVKNFYKQNKMNYPVVIGDQNVATLYGGIRGIPTTFVIDRNGNKVREYVGYMADSVFEADFLALK